MLPSPKLIVVDQSLRDHDGHHCDYDQSVAQAAQAMSIQTIVVAHRECPATLALLFPSLRQHFTRSWTEVHLGPAARVIRKMLTPLRPEVRALAIATGSRARRLLPRSSQQVHTQPTLPSFGREVIELVDKEQLKSIDHVFIHTLAVAELHSLVEALTNYSSELPTVHVLLRRDADEPAVQNGPWGGIQTAFGKIRTNECLKAHVRFYSDTHALCRQYEALSGGLPVRPLPIPHALSEVPAHTGPRTPGPVCATYLGNARTEKGFHHLPDAIDALRASYTKTGRLRFVLQANANLSLEDAVISMARRRLARYASNQVKLLPHPLTITEFQARLVESDVILLPYNPECYRRRSSGILVQSIICGRPVIVPRGTWLADEAPAAAAIQFDGPAELPRAIAAAVERIDALQAAARSAAPEWRRRHDAVVLVRALLH
jgi:hypothetical protein